MSCFSPPLSRTSFSESSERYPVSDLKPKSRVEGRSAASFSLPRACHALIASHSLLYAKRKHPHFLLLLIREYFCGLSTLTSHHFYLVFLESAPLSYKNPVLFSPYHFPGPLQCSVAPKMSLRSQFSLFSAPCSFLMRQIFFFL